ncbi:hypothetical protein ACFV3R_00640 [Streptomyces sp. NPDC059740]|uniref:hypothetical protein n=1 Tax=Streptomyces sp. NPDC059740 TaxID=3346926 RepID=UPI00365C09A9
MQALDPLLKQGKAVTFRQGFIPQPVVRLTGERDSHGELLDGFLTSFVNVSRVQYIAHLDEYAEALDGWLYVLSRLGFHARHIRFSGRAEVWHRRQVAGMTLMFHHLDLAVGDMVLLWNVGHPDRLALDLGTGLERLLWARSRRPWGDLLFGGFSGTAMPNVLDAMRTATLLLGSGITPAARGAGSVTRRALATVPADLLRFGSSSIVRAFHDFWSTCTPLPVPWPAVTSAMEAELASRMDRKGCGRGTQAGARCVT